MNASTALRTASFLDMRPAIRSALHSMKTWFLLAFCFASSLISAEPERGEPVAFRLASPDGGNGEASSAASYRQAIKAGDANAYVPLGLCYELGIGGETVNPPLARRCQEEGARLGSGAAMFQLALCHASGTGVLPAGATVDVPLCDPNVLAEGQRVDAALWCAEFQTQSAPATNFREALETWQRTLDAWMQEQARGPRQSGVPSSAAPRKKSSLGQWKNPLDEPARRMGR
jgi:TPR repeat protein